ncbi:L-serine ammonia-lyase, iron-sulfur-dependent, subunit alpha [uncultured Fusobacterium sp.]|uniref:L-serine ammonia-lyase, iron-sulfur-dependent, subunit alpha n=1 Tax=uncultured Fusobacterium sp. TaxID=159267 RepID=UPI0015A54B34|nr:L-serine ammonia-lyase, iron-sulfur-dependent, subunit alpha [uncultured Fusobacterium sp.]
MDSLKELFKIGCGPSSSHTMGPERAAKRFKAETEDAVSYRVELYGSLAATGKGHLTDWIIEETLKPKKTEIVWMPEFIHPYHTNGMKFEALDENGNVLKDWLVFSVGGGTIKELTDSRSNAGKCYSLTKMDDIIKWCKENNKELWEYVEHCEGKEIWDHLKNILDTMNAAVSRGIKKDGVLPGKLRYPRKAKEIYDKIDKKKNYLVVTKKIFAYALAVAEENSSAGTIVTAPTCGAAGVIPGLLRALIEEYELDETTTLRALAIAGLIGNLIKENATISGAEAGCQAEIGAACSMASGMAVYILGGNIDQIEYAAEMGMEHHLGMTCDPVGGYVQIPCIERNAIVAVRSLNTADYALSTNGEHTISFDQVVITMKETGSDMCSSYKETSTGGLAKYYDKFLNA